MLKKKLNNMKYAEFVNSRNAVDEANGRKLVEDIEDIKDADDDLENYMFFGNLETVKRHAEMLLALNPTEVDAILKDGHNWAADHISTCKDDIEEVCNFLQNETKEAGTGVIPNESVTVDEAIVQIAGKDKPSGAKVVATVIADYMEENKMLDANFVSAAHGGKNKKFLVESLAKFIMDNTF